MNQQFTRYLLVSVVALIVDYASLLALASTGIRESVAAAPAYCAGALLHYVGSRRFVFAPGWMHARPLGEFGAFLACGGVGLAITVAIVFVASEIGGFALLTAKTLAVASSFFVVYLIRRSFVFRGALGAATPHARQ